MWWKNHQQHYHRWSKYCRLLILTNSLPPTFSLSHIPSLPPSHSHTFPPSYRLTLTNSLPSVFSPSNIPSLTPSHFIILKELQSLFPCAVPSDGTNIDETTSKLYECTPEVCREERGEGGGEEGKLAGEKSREGRGRKIVIQVS